MKRVAFVLKYPLKSPQGVGNVVGDELYALSLSSELNSTGMYVVDLLGNPSSVDSTYETIVYFNDNFPSLDDSRAKKILYLQNGYTEGSIAKLLALPLEKFEKIFVLSDLLKKKLAKYADPCIVFTVPFGSIISPESAPNNQPKHDFRCDISYLGNNIKGAAKTSDFFESCALFDFRIYGNWKKSKRQLTKIFFTQGFREFKLNKQVQPYAFGKLDQAYVIDLYKSSLINLNLTIDDCILNDVVTLRTLDILNVGGFLISDSRSSQLSKGYITCTNGSTLLSAIKEFLPRSYLREEIMLEGQALVRSSMLIKHTAEKFMEFM